MKAQSSVELGPVEFNVVEGPSLPDDKVMAGKQLHDAMFAASWQVAGGWRRRSSHQLLQTFCQ
jgi:hypothetical protein